MARECLSAAANFSTATPGEDEAVENFSARIHADVLGEVLFLQRNISQSNLAEKRQDRLAGLARRLPRLHPHD